MPQAPLFTLIAEKAEIIAAFTKHENTAEHAACHCTAEMYGREGAAQAPYALIPCPCPSTYIRRQVQLNKVCTCLQK
jgi:hypothetical protein